MNLSSKIICLITAEQIQRHLLIYFPLIYLILIYFLLTYTPLDNSGGYFV